MDLLVVELKTDAKNRVTNLVFSLSYIKEGLAKVSAQIQVCSGIERLDGVIAAVVQLLTEFPAALPGFFMCVRGSRTVKYALSVDVAKIGQGVAKGPTFL